MSENTSESFQKYLKRARERLLILPGATTVYHKADGVYVWDLDGKKYIDANARAGQISFGHHNPLAREIDEKMFAAGVQCFETIGDFWQTEIEVAGTQYEISPPALAEFLANFVYSGDAYVVPQVSGTIANNSIIKVCERLRPDRRIFVAFEGAYQGRSGAALSLTNANGNQKSWNAPGLQTVHIPFVESEEDVDRAIMTLIRIDPKSINAIFFEGVQSVGGMRAQSPHVKKVLEFLRENGVLIFADEIYVGFYRSGKKFSFEYYDFVPDGIAMAKVIGQGLPISASIIRKEVFEREGKEVRAVCPIGWEGGTFNWSPFAVARGIVMLSHYEKENIGAHVRAIAEYFESKVGPIIDEFNKTAGGEMLHLTGHGLMRGFCFRSGRKTYPQLMGEVSTQMFANGVIFTAAGHPAINPTLCFTPPLIIEKKHIDEFLGSLKTSLMSAFKITGLK